jgi:hypothetical protein
LELDVKLGATLYQDWILLRVPLFVKVQSILVPPLSCSILEQMGFSNNVFSRLEIMLAELNHLVKIAVHEFVQYCRDGESDCVIRKRSDSIKFLSIKSEAFT